MRQKFKYLKLILRKRLSYFTFILQQLYLFKPVSEYIQSQQIGEM